MSYPLRLRVVLGIVTVSALLSNGHAIWARRPTAATEPDEVSRVEGRLRRLKDILPPRGTVGYLGDPRRSGDVDLESAKRLYLTQHALAPLVVREGIEPRFVVGYFVRGTAAEAVAGTDLVLVEDLGEGIYLWRHRER